MSYLICVEGVGVGMFYNFKIHDESPVFGENCRIWRIKSDLDVTNVSTKGRLCCY